MRLLLALVLAFLLTACDIPRDPEGTLERVTGSNMKVGIAEHPPWTFLGDEPSGIEVELVEEFARELGAEILWVEGAESEILEQVELGRIDLAIAGLTADNPWASKASFIQPYFTAGPNEHVMAVPHGENAWIVRLERFLRSRHSEIPALLEEHTQP
jgi:polar amino acid transport system substrate-binding protein